MRAAYYEQSGPAGEVLRVGDMQRPEPGEGEVCVRLHVSGVNPSDVKKRMGRMPAPAEYARIVPHNSIDPHPLAGSPQIAFHRPIDSDLASTDEEIALDYPIQYEFVCADVEVVVDDLVCSYYHPISGAQTQCDRRGHEHYQHQN